MIHGLFKSEIIGGARGWEFFLQGGSFFIGREWLESNNFANFNQKSSLIAPLIFKSEIIGGSREWLESHNFERFIALSLLFIAAYVPTYFIHIYLLLFPFVVSHVYRHLHTSNIFIFFFFLFFSFFCLLFSPLCIRPLHTSNISAKFAQSNKSQIGLIVPALSLSFGPNSNSISARN